MEGFDNWDNPEEDVFALAAQETADVEQESTDVRGLVEEKAVVTPPAPQAQPSAQTLEKPEDLFAKAQEDDDDSEEEDDDSEGAPSTESESNPLDYLVTKGFIDFEFEEGKTYTNAEKEEILEDKFDELIEDRIKEKFLDLPEDYKHLISYGLKGGSLNTFLQEMSKNITQTTFTGSEEDFKNEKFLRDVVYKGLIEDGNDEDFAEEQLELLKTGNKLETFARKYVDRSNKKIAKMAEDNAVAVAEAKRKDIEKTREDKRKYAEILSKNKSLNGLEFSKEVAKNLPSFMKDKTVQLTSGALITEFQKQLAFELPKSEVGMAQLAILLQTRNEDGSFNFKAIADAEKSKATSELQQEIRSGKTTDKTVAKRPASRGTSLADMFGK
jgi:hypothetical protein